jgi:TonB family protein
MKVAGRVDIDVLVGENGSVESAKAVTGNPLLTQSALTAVEKWKLTPFTAEGKAVKAIGILSFDFPP